MMANKAFIGVVGAGITAALAAVSGPVSAEPITLNFMGAVTQATYDPFDPFMGAFTVGSSLHSVLSFDTNAVDAAPSPSLGSYTLSGFPYGFTPFAGFPQMQTVNVSIVDGVGGAVDQYSVFASEGTAGALGDYFSMSILLEDPTGTAFSSDALLPGMPELARFAVRSFVFAGQYTNVDGEFIQFEVQGNLVAVPEPAMTGLVALALLGCAAPAFGRRRGRCTRRDL